MATLDATAMAVTHCASRDETRYGLGGVRLEHGLAVATDGHCLGAIELPAVDETEFPAVPGIADDAGPVSPCTVPLDGALDMSKALAAAARTHRSTHPILRHGRFLVTNGTGPETATLVTFDGDMAPRTVQARTVQAEFPDVARVFPQDEPKARVGFDAAILARCLKAATAVAAGGRNGGRAPVVLEFWEETGPVRILAADANGRQGVFLAMPLKV